MIGFFASACALAGSRRGETRTALSRCCRLRLFLTPSRKSAAFCFAKLRGGSAPSGPAATEGLDLHFPAAPLCPYFSRLLGKVLHFASQNCVGILRPPDQPPRRDLTCTFPLLPSAPISHAFSEKCCILLRKIAWGFCALRTKKTGCRKSDILFFWSARRDLNPQPLESESTAISNFATGGYGTSRIVHHSPHFCKPFLPFLF